MTSRDATLSFTIGQIAKLAAVSTQTLRYYERAGLLLPKTRSGKGYRTYDLDSLRKLRFIKEAQELGFTLTEIKELLRIRVSSTAQQCEKVHSKTEAKLKAVQVKIRELRKLETTLKELIRECGEQKTSSRCSIIERMEQA